MQYKRQVLKRFPTAEAVTVETWEDGSPRHWSVISELSKSEEQILDVHDRHHPQGATAAWQSAYAWCMRNHVKAA